MAKETKFIQVHPSNVESTIEIWQCFGWDIMGAPQEIFNKDSHLEASGEDTYSVTTTTHYVKITFQRDKNIPNYAQLVELENKYNSIPNPPPAPVRFGMLWLIVSAVGLILYVVPGILIIVWRFVDYSKKLPEWQKQVAKIRAKEKEIIKRAQALTL